MNKRIRFEITADGEIHVKTLGMDDASCLDYIEVFERLLDAETIDSEFTQEFINKQILRKEEAQIDVEEDIQIKGD